MLKKIVLVFLLLAVTGGAIGSYLYFKPSRNFREVNPDITVKATDIIRDYSADETVANSKYLNKVVEVQGVVNDVSTDEKGFTNINLAVQNEMAMVSCAMDSICQKAYQTLTKGTEVRIKGQCTGMLMDVVMVKSVLVE